MDVWSQCQSHITATPISGELIRLVESQEQIATSHLVDDLEKQALLEQLLEQSKPAAFIDTGNLHYLLSTPFRYPPLPWGSRFGSALEPGLFYGSKHLHTTLAEAAFYRFIFWYDMATPPTDKYLTQHTLFAAEYCTDRGLQLQSQPFSAYQAQLTHPQDYTTTQQLGHYMHQFGIEAFEYVSARDAEKGLNVALFSPNAFSSEKPTYQQDWLCETRENTVVYSSSETDGVYQFGIELFQVDGGLPRPAG